MRDTRIIQAEQLIKDARQLLDDVVEEDAATPVDRARLQRVSQYLSFALAACEYFTRPYLDERR